MTRSPAATAAASSAVSQPICSAVIPPFQVCMCGCCSPSGWAAAKARVCCICGVSCGPTQRHSTRGEGAAVRGRLGHCLHWSLLSAAALQSAVAAVPAAAPAWAAGKALPATGAAGRMLGARDRGNGVARRRKRRRACLIVSAVGAHFCGVQYDQPPARRQSLRVVAAGHAQGLRVCRAGGGAAAEAGCAGRAAVRRPRRGVERQRRCDQAMQQMQHVGPAGVSAAAKGGAGWARTCSSSCLGMARQWLPRV